MRLVVSATAAAQIREASAWWSANRPAAPDLLRSELRRAFELITSLPGSGPMATNVELSAVRRVFLRRTRYHLYYIATEEEVTVIAVWHSRRGSGPNL